MRALLDTNILARAARGGTGPAAELVRRFATLPNVLIVSPFLISELARVLRYERVRRMHGLDDEGINAYVQQIEGAALVVDVPMPIAPIVSRDPDDDPVISAAIAGHAEVLCTLDRHIHQAEIRAYCTQHGVRVMSDIDLLALIHASDGTGQP